MPTYVKRHWNQTRGDEYDAWGTSWWYFEVAPDGWVTRQIEQYDGGVRLCYSTVRSDDQFGALAETPPIWRKRLTSSSPRQNLNCSGVLHSQDWYAREQRAMKAARRSVLQKGKIIYVCVFS